jgi:O-antigen/teichoic acid export membrane protein
LLLLSADRIMLTQFVPPSALGLYSIANKLATMMSVLSNAAWSAWWPMALEMGHRPDAPRQYARMFEYFSTGTMRLALIIGLSAADVLAVFTRTNCVPAAPYTLALLIYFGLCSSIFSSMQIVLYTHKRTRYISLLVFIGAAVNIALNLILDPPLGVWGAVWATVLAGVVIDIAAYAIAQRISPVPYHLPRFLSLVAIYLLIVGVALLNPRLGATVVYKVNAPLILMLSILATGVITWRQLDSASQSVKARWQNINLS